MFYKINECILYIKTIPTLFTQIIFIVYSNQVRFICHRLHPEKLKSWTDISVAPPAGKWTKTDVNRSGRSHVCYIILLHMQYLGLQRTMYSYMVIFFKNAWPLSLSKYCTKGLQLIVSTEKLLWPPNPNKLNHTM